MLNSFNSGVLFSVLVPSFNPVLLSPQQRLQFSDNPTASLPRQQYKSTPQSESFSTPMSAFPWERDDSRLAARRRSPSSPQTPLANVISQGQSEQGLMGRKKNPTAETDSECGFRQSVDELIQLCGLSEVQTNIVCCLQ